MTAFVKSEHRICNWGYTNVFYSVHELKHIIIYIDFIVNYPNSSVHGDFLHIFSCHNVVESKNNVVLRSVFKTQYKSNLYFYPFRPCFFVKLNLRQSLITPCNILKSLTKSLLQLPPA